MNRDNLILYHQGSIPWTCEPCMDKASSADTRTVHNGDQPEAKEKEEGGVVKDSLKILQWNADGLASKIHELRLKADELAVDAIIIQESKLEESHATPKIPGFTPIRPKEKNRRQIKQSGGGVISYVNSALCFEKRKDECKDATETSSFAIKTSGSKWIEICNVYCPPASSPGYDSLRLATEIIATPSNSIICGDLNAHSFLWDRIEDDRGSEVEDWIIEKNLGVLNDGSPTRIDRGRDIEPTAPDVTICSSSLTNKCSWRPIDGIGSSDHQPILIEIAGKVKHNPVYTGQAKWKTRDVDWQAWQDEIDSSISAMSPSDLPTTIKARVLRFNKILEEASHKHLGKVKPGKRNKTWVTPTVRAAIRKRNYLRRNVRTKRREWLEACKETQEEIKKAKEESWKELLEDAISDVDQRKMWGIIKSMNGTPDSNSPNEVLIYQGKKVTTDKGKADAFASHYANVSKHSFSKEERAINRDLRKRISASKNEDDKVPDFTMHELKKAIKDMKKK